MEVLCYFRAMLSDISNLIQWYHQKGRELPWRSTDEPYKIWLSEIILQQTRVDQGLKYYHRFIKTFPSVYDLAAASEETILKQWQGLGYYTRARNLHKAAKIVVNEYDGALPASYKNLLKLPGIGEYTAAAISSIAFNESVAAVDGNVKRVISRVYAIQKPIDEPQTIKEINDIANVLIEDQNPGDFNQAMMELGATLCKPKKPLCRQCPLLMSCQAQKYRLQNHIPKKRRKTQTRTRYFNYYVFLFDGHTSLNIRTKNDIWKGLFEFPLIETSETQKPKQLINNIENYWNIAPHEVKNIDIKGPYKHVLTHQKIEASFVIVKLKSKNQNLNLPIALHELDTYPVSRLIEFFLNNQKKFL